jgi:integrase
MERKKYKVIKKFAGLRLVTRHTTDSRISYMLVIQRGKRRVYETLFAASVKDTAKRNEAISIALERSNSLNKQTTTVSAVASRKKDFFEFFEQFIQSKRPLSQKSWRTALVHLRRWHGNEPLPFGHLTKGLCHDFRAYLEKAVLKGEMKATSANVVLGKFKAALNEAAARDFLPFSPAATLKALPAENSETVFLTSAELSRLFNTPSPTVRGVDEHLLRCYAIFLVRTGFAPVDAQKLVWTDIQPDGKGGFFVDLVRSKTRRTGVRSARVPLHADAVAALLELRKRLPVFNSTDKIFIGLPTGATTIIRWLRQWCAAANIHKPLTTYSLRHTYATTLFEAGGDLYSISKLLLHSSTNHTARYTHLLDEQKRATLDLLPPLSATFPETAR